MWVAVTEFTKKESVLLNTLSGMRIMKCDQDACRIEISDSLHTVLTIRADFDSLVLSLQALDLRQ